MTLGSDAYITNVLGQLASVCVQTGLTNSHIMRVHFITCCFDTILNYVNNRPVEVLSCTPLTIQIVCADLE